LAAGEELGLGDDRAAPAGLTALAATLLLRLQAGAALDRLRLAAPRLAHPGHGPGRVVLARAPATGATAVATTTAAAAATACRASRGLVLFARGVVGVVAVVAVLSLVGVVLVVGGALVLPGGAVAAATAPSAPAPTSAGGLLVAVVPVVGRVVRGVLGR